MAVEVAMGGLLTVGGMETARENLRGVLERWVVPERRGGVVEGGRYVEVVVAGAKVGGRALGINAQSLSASPHFPLGPNSPPRNTNIRLLNLSPTPAPRPSQRTAFPPAPSLGLD